MQSKRVPDSVPTSTRQVCVCLVRQTDGSAVWEHVLKKIWNTPKFSLSSLQSCAGSPQTVTNLIPSCIIHLFYSDNMNLCGGKAREGELTADWAKDGVEERMMDGACACDSLDFFFQFNTLHFIKGKIVVVHFSHWWCFYHYDMWHLDFWPILINTDPNAVFTLSGAAHQLSWGTGRSVRMEQFRQVGWSETI